MNWDFSSAQLRATFPDATAWLEQHFPHRGRGRPQRSLTSLTGDPEQDRERQRQMRELYAAGTPIAQIARRYGYDPRTVEKWLR